MPPAPPAPPVGGPVQRHPVAHRGRPGDGPAHRHAAALPGHAPPAAVPHASARPPRAARAELAAVAGVQRRRAVQPGADVVRGAGLRGRWGLPALCEQEGAAYCARLHRRVLATAHGAAIGKGGCWACQHAMGHRGARQWRCRGYCPRPPAGRRRTLPRPWPPTPPPPPPALVQPSRASSVPRALLPSRARRCGWRLSSAWGSFSTRSAWRCATRRAPLPYTQTTRRGGSGSSSSGSREGGWLGGLGPVGRGGVGGLELLRACRGLLGCLPPGRVLGCVVLLGALPSCLWLPVLYVCHSRWLAMRWAWHIYGMYGIRPMHAGAADC
jgi:hypothetical protein